MSDFDWEDLIDFICREKRVTPVIGDDLLRFADGSSFEERLAAALAQAFSAPVGDSPLSLARLTAQLTSGGLSKADIAVKLNRIQRKLLAALNPEDFPEPLRQLAEITDFDLVLTSSTCDLPTRAWQAARRTPPLTIGSALNATEDLPGDWRAGNGTVIFHLFGQIAPGPTFMLTEEDTIEYMSRMQGATYQPKRLFDELRKRHLLLLGQRFPDWLARSFLRTLRGTSFSAASNRYDAIATDLAQRDEPFVQFLNTFSRQTWIYEEGGTAAFVSELHARWKAAQGPAVVSAIPPAKVAPEGPDVFISFSSANRDAATKLCQTLNAANLRAWLDSRDLDGGDQYMLEIRRSIQRCALFVPLLSAETELRDEGPFRQEWAWAVARAGRMDSSRRFLYPIIVDNSDPNGLQKIPEEFEVRHMTRAPGGEMDQAGVEKLIGFVRAIRDRRTALA